MATNRRVARSEDRQVEPTAADSNYELVRKAGPFELLTHLFHELGIQSNILVYARYAHAGKASLTPWRMFRALEAVVKEHPALAIIDASQPSEKKEGNHRLWEARLSAIDLKDCVKFITDDASGDRGLSRIFEKAHNRWFDTQDKTKPWWKIIVVNGLDVVFIYHHSIADGLSGYTFHRSLLEVLNANESPSTLAETPVDALPPVISVPDKSLAPCPFDLIDEKLSWPYVIYCFLFWYILRKFINEKYFLFSDATFSKTYSTVAKPLPIEERTITRVETLRIDSDTMKKCLDACRTHETSFTALLHTLIEVTLAADVYTNAKLGFSRQAVNIRPLLRVNSGPGVFTNAVSTYCRVQWLGKYQAAGANPVPILNTQGLFVNSPLVWELARKYKSGMNSFIQSRGTVQDFLTGKLLGEDEEDAGTFYGLGLYQNNSFLMLNLGAFLPQVEMEDGGWSIKDVGFSAGAIRASMGDFGIVFNIASVQDGDCLICATYEKGVLKDEMVKRVLDGVIRRLELLLEA